MNLILKNSKNYENNSGSSSADESPDQMRLQGPRQAGSGLPGPLGSAPLGPEDVDGSDDVLAADGALAHPLPTLGAGDHVTTFQQDAVDGRVHADLAQVLLQTCAAAARL